MVGMKRIYLFNEGNATMKNLLGGKGANLAEMTNIGLPVPQGFTITTEVCREYSDLGRLPDGLMEEVKEAMRYIEEKSGKKFGDPTNPLLVSVRSGAPISMPGMMDTILNLGLNDETVKTLAEKAGEKFAYDCYRRLLQMFGEVVMGVEANEFESAIQKKKHDYGVETDQELPPKAFMELVEEFKSIIKNATNKEFPQDPNEQLRMAIEAVFRSWNNPRAKVYRKLNNIPDDMGTAVNVQMMVFGNFGDNSGTGVAFTRNPATGENKLYGEYLINAQGEDVVAGIRTPKPISELEKDMPEIYQQFVEIAKKLEKHYKDMQDIEFTIENRKLYILQTRTGKRTAAAAVKVAYDMVQEGLITKEEALLRIDPDSVNQLLHRQIDPNAKLDVIATGLPASPGAATGKIVFTADDAEEKGKAGEPVILVRTETTPDDIHGIVESQGVLTSRGGMTSHAAVVARGMGMPCVSGCDALKIDLIEKTITVGDKVLHEGDWISIDGSTGKVILGKVPLIEPTLSNEFKTILDWANEFKRLQVRTNADTPQDSAKAREFGAEGIGLCRTEHMFMAQDRLPIVQEMIMAETKEEREKALQKLLPMQRSDFYEIFKVMEGLPVNIRLLDPPLHEFLPNIKELLVDIAILRERGAPQEEIDEKERILKKVQALEEMNPMLGHRGVRLGITYPEIYEMQARAIFEAACQLKKEGVNVIPEVEIPLVANYKELERMRERVEKVAEQVFNEQGVTVEYTVGTMIELPRACITADEIAKYADFFSFGTNDLTQTTYGFSRDDAEGKFMQQYLAEKIIKYSPFVVLDFDGVGQLMKIAMEKARNVNPDIIIGICGEQGGEPKSVEFCHRIGLDYVSCSPFRVPIARIAAAQAAIKEKMGK
ncbi:MAG: pyruvate, phosphate dikinase [Candidatus Diapherotrites archaeon]|nr:pyruvate, phosphate dikinase [Candidatus Diapherotrites archaeon]